MSPSVVQSKSYSSATSISATGTLVFDTTPVAGNILIVGMSYAFGKSPSAPPTGWQLVDLGSSSTTSRFTVYTHKVVQGETNSYAFTTNGGDYLSVCGFEVTNQSPTKPIAFESSNALTGSTITTPSLTPTTLNNLALSFYMSNDGNSASTTSVTASSGWTVDQNPKPDFHAMACGHKNSVTSDLTTSISNVWTWNSSSDLMSVIILISPTGSHYSVGSGMSRSEGIN